MNRSLGLPGDELVVKIPRELLEIYQQEVHVVVKYPWVIGIPAPELLFERPELLQKLRELKNFEVMLVPVEVAR
jgi:hypothetical protein